MVYGRIGHADRFRSAEAYPNTFVVGVDLCEHAIDEAKRRQEERGITNVVRRSYRNPTIYCNQEFVVGNAGDLTKLQSASFDVVTIFDSCHDQTRPDLVVWDRSLPLKSIAQCLKEVHRLLKSGGTFTMLEVYGRHGRSTVSVQVNGSSSAFVDSHNEGAITVACYAISLFHCLPIACNAPGTKN